MGDFGLMDFAKKIHEGDGPPKKTKRPKVY
jgi:hypothetical protein